MKRLRVLRLMHTKITDTTLAALGSLDQLQSLSLFDTAVTQAALPAISSLPKLRHVYVRGTKITENSSLPAEMRSKLVF
jgi:Leucine-rich repeat (LRR) protein